MRRVAGIAPLRAVTFDLDDTLYDFQACMNHGAARVVAALCKRYPNAAAHASVDLFHELWREATTEARAEGSQIDWTRVRLRGIERLLGVCGCEDPTLAEELTALYFRHRRVPVLPFEDAAAAVAQLVVHLPLGIITNGNTELLQIGLAEPFRVVLSPATTEHRKPDPRVFHQAAAALGCAPEELLHVGDRFDDDIAGALRAGCQAAWYCRAPEVENATCHLSEWFPGGPGSPPMSYLVVGNHRALAAWVLERLRRPLTGNEGP